MPRIIRGSWLIHQLHRSHVIITQKPFKYYSGNIYAKTYDIIVLYGAIRPQTYCFIFQQVTCIHFHTELRIKERHIFRIRYLCNSIHTMDNFNLQIT